MEKSEAAVAIGHSSEWALLFQEAIALIEPLVTAKENYVRQGAVIALAFIMIQQTESTCPKVGATSVVAKDVFFLV